MTVLTPLVAAKAEARIAAFAARKRAHAAGGVAAIDAAARLTEVLAPHAGKVLSGYMPMRTEIDPLPVMAAHSGPVCVPVIIGKDQPLMFRRWTPDARMIAGTFGAQIPEAGDWLVPEVLIVPLVAFDRQGHRLGYGGGFYDRTLAGLRTRGPVLAIGFAFSAQELPEIPVEHVDERLDLIVTERGVIRRG